MILEILLALWIFYVFLIVGVKTIKIFRLSVSKEEQLILGTALGIGFISYFVFFSGLVGLIYSYYFAAILAILTIILTPGFIEFVKDIKVKIKFNWLIIPIIIFLLFSLIGSLAPQTGWDPQLYHLPAQKEYIKNHKIVETPFLIADLPALADMIILLGMILKNDTVSGFIFYLVFLLLVFSIYVYTKKYLGNACSILAVLIFLSVPLIIYCSGTTLTDLFLTLFIFLSVICFYELMLSNDFKWLILTSAFAGISFATKITSVLYLIGFFIMLAMFFVYRKDKNGLKKMLLSGVIIAALISPWLIKTYAFTGNPVYPLAYNLFGGVQNLSYATEYTMKQAASGGYGTSVFDYLLSPFQLTINGYKFMTSFTISPLFLVFLPVLFFIRKNKFVNLLLIMSLLFYTSWFFVHHYPIKIVPMIPLLSILTSYASIESFRNNLMFKIISLFIVFAVLFSIASSFLIYKNQIKAALFLESREHYLSSSLQIYDAFDYANHNLQNSDKILLIGEWRNYYLNIPFQIGDPTAQGVIDYRVLDDKSFIEWIHKQRITYLIVNRRYFVNITDQLNLYGYTKYSADLIENFVKENTQLIFEKNNVFLYKVTI